MSNNDESRYCAECDMPLAGNGGCYYPECNAPQKPRQTEPEQWAVEARRHAVELEQCSIFAADVGPSIAKAMTDAAEFLRAFEERERKLREALEWIRDHAVKLRKGTDDWFELVEIEAVATQALKETPDAQ